MDIHLPALYKDYGLYSNYRNFPMDIDGLKPVERRVLFAAYKIARTGWKKSRQVDSHTTGHYHPHGECVSGNTIILLLDGRKIKIKDLIGEDSFWVYSCTKDGVIKPGRAHSVRVVKKVSKLYRIYINDKYEDVTPDHPFMNRDGSYTEAQNLKVGDSLMPLYIREENGYVFYKDNSRTICREEKVSWMVSRELIDSNLDSKIGRQKYHVHHKNTKRNDDRPNNLEVIYYKDHCSETSKNRSDESNKTIGLKVKQAYQTNKNNFKTKALEGLEKGRQRMFSDDSPIREKIRNKNSKLITEYNKIYVEDRILKILHKMISDNIDINENTYDQYRTKIYNGPLWKTIFKKFDNIEEAIDLAQNYNHKVSKIEIINLENDIEVCDMSVEKYHNFATDSGIFVHNCYGTIVQLVRQGFLDGQGNFGTNVGAEPVGAAAPRYTECKLQADTLELAFEYIKHVPFVDTELGDKEPFYLPTMFPICLMGNEYTQGIGFGYKTYIPCYDAQDLYQRLLWLLGIRKRKPIIAPLTDCNIISKSKDIEQLLTTGKAKIEVAGIFDVNPRNSTVTLKSWPPGKRFESLLNKFAKELNENMIGYTDLSSTETEIVFQILRERNRTKIFENFVEKLQDSLNGFISFEMIMTDVDRKVMIKSVDDMLLDTYKMFCTANEEMLKHEIANIKEVITEYQLLEKIKAPLSQCIAEGRDMQFTFNVIQKAVGVAKATSAMLVDKYKIRKLLTLNTDTSELENKVNEHMKNLAELTPFVLEQYNGRYK